MEIRKTRKVRNLDNEVDYIFDNVSPLEALNKMIYFLNLNHKCNPKIFKSESGRTLWFEDEGNIYATIID